MQADDFNKRFETMVVQQVLARMREGDNMGLARLMTELVMSLGTVIVAVSVGDENTEREMTNLANDQLCRDVQAKSRSMQQAIAAGRLSGGQP